MELRQLRYFEAVATTLNFSQAAKKLHIAQPPLSRQIKQLEDELGAVLIDRNARPMALTKAGVYLHAQATRMLADKREVKEATLRIANESQRQFRIGFVPTMLYGFLPELINRFRREHETIEVQLAEMTTVQQIEGLKSGRIDVGFGRLAIEDPELEHETVSQDALVAALPLQHPLLAKSEVSLADVASQSFILHPTKSRPSCADQILEAFRDRKLKPKALIDANDMQTALGMVAAGIGVTLVPAAQHRLQRDDIAYVPLQEVDITSPVIMNVRAGPRSDMVLDLHDLIGKLKA